ncbi:MAG: pseudouridine synthase [Reichenbachiella sp.]|uniref:RluA family pseudouridine synthase n=1 Tax=Reichenbachiella sp. TaxID=2184521 RepID=UPI003266937B
MNQEAVFKDQYFTQFDQSIEGIALPDRFTFPFFYEPHALCRLAVEQLQKRLLLQTDWQHDFGIDHYVEGVNIGKMFGVLIVRNARGEIGFLSAFSGKLAEQHNLPGFVPPIVDYLQVDSFFRQGEKEIEEVTENIMALVDSREYQLAKDKLEQLKNTAELELASSKEILKNAKKSRKARREEASKTLTVEEYKAVASELEAESMKMHYECKDLKRKWKGEIAELETIFGAFEQRLASLKDRRRALSNQLQQKIFDQYQFLNIEGQTKSVCEIFETTAFKIPPSGAGDCALPKLLQYAFQNKMIPLAMAEFWWGQSPSSEIRKHGYFYPSCKGKCEPILSHMLAGMAVDQSPMLTVSTEEKRLKIVFEDDYLVVVNKPHEFLSVPGKSNADSVLARMAKQYPEATGPLLVHRLDRATSGLLLVAKTKEVHKSLQDQFLTRSIKKRYVALLEGNIDNQEGMINLPVRPDIEDRPRQLVCHEYGKPATTKYRVVKVINNRTLIHLWPLTGRTHQLRVHAAHQDGLNTPMVGDDLYGKTDSRLHLQAAALEFTHPVTGERVHLELPAEF